MALAVNALGKYAERDVDIIMGHITRWGELICLCSPGNPTGTLISLKSLRSLLDYESFKGIVVVGEAYIDFVGEDASALSSVADQRLRGVEFEWGFFAETVARGYKGYIFYPADRPWTLCMENPPHLVQKSREVMTHLPNETYSRAAPPNHLANTIDHHGALPMLRKLNSMQVGGIRQRPDHEFGKVIAWTQHNTDLSIVSNHVTVPMLIWHPAHHFRNMQPP
ncbi:hypothetical protein BKA82DRAFT_4015262 [Pisolithus tinctorius]|nr:hypothetical protein BKA82DRAFT_4015262 [Pisolithus tinctorius]